MIRGEVSHLKWNKFRLKTTAVAEEVISALLMELGIEGVEIQDKQPIIGEDKAHMFGDIPPDFQEDDGIAYLNFYLDPDEDKETVLLEIKKELKELGEWMDIGEATIEESTTEDIDWVNNWKQYFKQFYVEDMLVIPSWEKVKEEDKGRLIIHMDPGTAFGTGMHETTQLCMKQLKKYVKPQMELLDVGCGSGILSIVALKLGAAHARGTDLDPAAITASEENKKDNGIKESAMDVMVGNIIDDEEVQKSLGYEAYDLAVANILPDVLVPLAPVVIKHLKENGIYIVSGIIEQKEAEVKEALLSAGFEILETAYQGEWVGITSRKK